ncbi:MAG: hypothetical protein ACFE96_12590 [Candidatus Hermodarchaeota archaeon]
MEDIDFSEKINRKIEEIREDVLLGKINLLELELNPIFSDIKDSLSIFNIKNYSRSYVNACELLNRKFEELRNLLSSLDIEKNFENFLKNKPNREEIYDIFKGCWNHVFELETLSFNFLEYSISRFGKSRATDLKIEHLDKERSDFQFLLEVPKLKFTEKVNEFFEEIKDKLPCYFEEVFESEEEQIIIYEKFVYLLHLLQLGRVKYQRETNTLYV